VTCLLASNTSTVTLLHARASRNDNHGISLNQCTARVENSQLDNNEGAGLQVTMGIVTAERSTIASNETVGLGISNSDFTIRNNFIYRNGTVGVTPNGGLAIQNTGQATEVFEFNTVAANATMNGGIAADVLCQTTPPATVSNNIVFTKLGDAPIVAGNCLWTYSAIEGGDTDGGNTAANPMFQNAASDNFHLHADSPLEGLADPAAITATDFDGDPRPQGTGRDMGADEIAP